MVDNYDVSAGRAQYTFTLRDGLKLHNGQPCAPPIASRRSNDGSKRDALGQKVAEATELSPYKCAKNEWVFR
jgi:ABC-type transport system substrate-binding protein